MSVHSRRAPSSTVLLTGLLLIGLLACSTASAATFCASSVPQLKVALALGTFQTQPFTIQIVQGTYLMDASVETDFSAPTTIEGGYTTNCAARTVDSSNTIIDIGQAHYFELQQTVGSPTAQLNMDGLTLANSGQGIILASGGFYSIPTADEGSIQLTRMRITQIGAGNTPPVSISAAKGAITLENILIDHVGTLLDCAVKVSAGDSGSVSINHMTAVLGNGSDFCLDDRGFDSEEAANFTIFNSILWNDGAGQAIFRGGINTDSNYTFVNDIFSSLQVVGGVSVQNQINSDPLWVDPAAGNYRLKISPLSPAINSGTLFASIGEPATDIEGHARIVGSAPDRGAYESQVTDQTTFIVSNTNDTGAGSLRDAITLANNNLSQKLIKFDIRNPANVPICPAVIALNSVLPIINSRMTIDGYTQPTSSKNTSPDAFNANLCVIIKPAAGTLASGFTVPANSFGSLVLRGVGMGGFGQPIRILGGQSSQITGSQFGGTANGISLPGASFNAITLASNASGNILVGGIAVGDRNVIGGASGSGIDAQTNATTSFTTCQLVNNLIGLAPNGISAVPNNFGINSTSSGCQIVGNRIAGNSITNLWVQGNHNVVQQNLVGFNIQNNGFFTSTTGILVTGSGNTIGAGGNGGSITSNTVRYNIAGGVVVKGDNAIANAINANRIYDNGGNSDGMDIDLLPTGGVAGPTPNDDTDFDSGPNGLQNFPVPKSLTYTGIDGVGGRPGNLIVQLNTQAGAYRVDAYFSNAINSLGKRGHAETILTHTTVQVPVNGRLSFSLPIVVPNQSAGGVISLTATDSAGNTSEIGTAMPTDTIFSDGLD